MPNILKRTSQRIFGFAGVKINGDNPWDIKVKHPRFYARVLSGGSLALGESYMDGWWDVESLDEFCSRVYGARIQEKVKSKDHLLNFIKASILNMQSRKRSRNVAEKHYDLGNDFYKDMLDKRMSYTCAYWKNTKDLDKAQEQKLDLVCRKINLKKGDKVLDLGCGWGSFAKFAAERYGCEVVAVNISKEQVAYARETCKGLPVKVILSDYRNTRGSFDKVVAIGLCEHTGYKNYRTFMKVAHRCLKKNGLFLVHTIGRNSPRPSIDPWIEKYIFPHAVLPSMRKLSEAAEGLFVVEDWHNFGSDYDKTLMAWFKNFDRNWPKYRQKYGDRFYRMWKYYLLACAGTFRSRQNQLWQIVLSKGGIPGGYESVR